MRAGGAPAPIAPAQGPPAPLTALPELRERLKKLYLRDYGGANRLDPDKVADDAFSPLRFHEQRQSLEGAVGPLDGKRILEIGAGWGAFVAYCRRDGIRAVGAEIDAPTASLARDLLRANGLTACPLAVAAGEALPFRPESFDVVFSNSVLEHVRDPARVLREALRVLRRRGRLHFIIPSYASFYESHYGIFWLPYLPRALAPLYVRLWRRDPRCLEGITFVTPGRLARALRGVAGIQVLGWGTDVFLRRMATLEFSEWGDLGKIKAWLRPVRRLGLNRLAARMCVACGWYNPIILTVEKT
ncbi:MAG TPA: class I SAM-dependent methyltransferase [Candidatus Methylomirabilis sp.]